MTCLHPATQLIKFNKKGYPYRSNHGPIWMCMTCDAFVGCHRGTIKPMGTPANGQLRLARREAHKAFDPLWKDGHVHRSKAYKLLSGHFGRTMHIGEANEAECQEIIEWALAKQFGL